MLKRAKHAVEEAAENNDADRSLLGAEEFVELAALDEFDRRRPALLELLLLLHERSGRKHDAVDVARRIFQRLTKREGGLLVVLGDELPMHMTGADAHFEHDRRVRGLRQFEALLDHPDHRRQIGARIEKPDLRLHRIGVAALLHDRGALAVILADDDQRAAGDAARSEVRERVRRDIGASRSISRSPRRAPDT